MDTATLEQGALTQLRADFGGRLIESGDPAG